MHVVHARVHRRFPELSPPPAGLAEFLLSKLAPGTSSPNAVLELAVEDLALVLACARREPEALRCFEEQYIVKVARMTGHMRLSAVQVDEVRQRLRVDLSIPRANGTLRLLDYAGRGDLQAWLRVSATRAALKILRRRSDGASLDEDDKLVDEHDAELSFLKRDQQLAFREALGEALASLDPRDVNRLRLHYLDGLSLEELATVEQVHRATVARWLAKARELLLANMRRVVMSKLRLSESECSSFMRLAQSRFDLSLRLAGQSRKF